MSKTVGYARVSTKEQNLDRQIKALLQYVAADMIVVDKASGKDLERPGYQSLKYGIGKLQKGDVLYILDCCNGEILSLEMRNNMKKELCIDTVKALRKYPIEGAILHSDRGSQYTSESFRETLKSMKIQQSLSGVAHCYDNARIESFFATLKKEALGDYLIVGVTSDDFDKSRGKINVQQSLMERIAAVKATGIADEIIIEEYEGQKIDDIRKYDVDIFTVGSDWIGKFDYLNEYCEVVYLSRTEGVSSSELREQKNELKMGLVGESVVLNKIDNKCSFVNGIKVTSVYTKDRSVLESRFAKLADDTPDYDSMLSKVDAIYNITSDKAL